MYPNPQETADLVTLTEEILKGKLFRRSFNCIIVKATQYSSHFNMTHRTIPRKISETF